MDEEVDVEKEYEMCRNDHFYYTSKYLWIEVKESGDFILLTPKPLQVKLEQTRQRQLKEKGYVRLNILKPRREGMSTWVESIIFSGVHLFDRTKAIIVAHNTTSAEEIYKMSKNFHEYLPDWFRRKTSQLSLRDGLTYAKTQSSIKFDTASEYNKARSKGYKVQHRSEVAFWDNAVETMKALNQTSKEFPDTEIYNESTPNGTSGIGAYFYDLWKDTKEGNNDYENFFIAWHENLDNKMKFRNTVELNDFKESVHSHKMIKRYGDEEAIISNFLHTSLCYEQLKWRRYYIDDKCGKDINVFMQEYPSDEDSCFLTSTGSFFNIDIIIGLEKHSVTGETGNLYWKNDRKEEVYFDPDPKGYLTIYKHPERNAGMYENRYCMGWDVSWGVETGDYTAGELLDRYNDDKLVHVAEWHGLLSADYVYDELLKIHYYYGGKVFHCIERQGEGNVMLSMLSSVIPDYLYKKRLVDREEEIEQNIYGFNMDAHSKTRVIPMLKILIDNNNLECYNKEFWEECKSFIKGELYSKGFGTVMSAQQKGKKGRASRRYDDRIIAMALAVEMSRVLPAVEKDKIQDPEWWLEYIHKQEKPKSYMEM